MLGLGRSTDDVSVDVELTLIDTDYGKNGMYRYKATANVHRSLLSGSRQLEDVAPDRFCDAFHDKYPDLMFVGPHLYETFQSQDRYNQIICSPDYDPAELEADLESFATRLLDGESDAETVRNAAARPV